CHCCANAGPVSKRAGSPRPPPARRRNGSTGIWPAWISGPVRSALNVWAVALRVSASAPSPITGAATWCDTGSTCGAVRGCVACAEAERLNRDLASLDLVACEERAERLGWSLARERLAALADYRRRNVLRHWLNLRGCAPLQRRQFAELERQFFSEGEPGASA